MSLLKQEKISIQDGNIVKFRLVISVTIFIIWSVIIFNILKDISFFLDWFEGLGNLAPLLFTLILIIGVVILAPTPIMKVTAGALFPYWLAVLINFTASIVGGLLAFLLGRWLFRDSIAKIVASDNRLQKIEAAIGEEAMRISLLVRLSPLIPDEWLNYIMASGPVTIRVFVLSTLSSVVYSLAYAYFGLAVGTIALSPDMMGGFQKSPLGIALLVLGIIATLIATIIVTRVTMKALNDAIEEE
ncbi:MAG: TVP38/TMEM64 family protein [Candidatus Poseidoniales archaeon]|nr:MAG: TVP38/TMEM64 family protein [Candidatus Poseidoniales archaeon]